MKKSTMAVAALLTALSTAPVMSVAYADEAPPAQAAGCSGCKGACNGCKGACTGCKGACNGCGGCKGE